jgi:radical SAM protein with 4Fe4S-binding SPASM domain
LLIALATNGTMIDKALARKIADAEFDRVSISLDGADAATHDGLRRQEGSFEGALRAMRLLTAENVAIQINCTIARHNKDQISAMLQLAQRLGADALHYFLLVPVGCGEQIFEDQMLTPEEVEERLGEIAELEENTDLQIKPTCAPHYYRITRQRKSRQQNQPASSSGHGHPGGALHSFTKGCLAGTGVCFVSHEGKVFPCGYLPVEAGDVRTMPFDQIWRESSLFGELRDDTTLKGKCSICKFSKVCGGCRARAYHKYQDYLQAEPYCLHQPEPR